MFMTVAWYGHLKYRKAPLFAAIVVSWLIAFFEYCFQVPANRFGYGQFTAYQLKVIQEVITLCVFVVFAWLYLGETVKWNHVVSFLFLVGAVTFAFWASCEIPEHRSLDFVLRECRSSDVRMDIGRIADRISDSVAAKVAAIGADLGIGGVDDRRCSS
jgi:uncharacterized protein (DUF486 family)